MIHSFLESILLGEQTSKIFPKLVLLTNKHLDKTPGKQRVFFAIAPRTVLAFLDPMTFIHDRFGNFNIHIFSMKNPLFGGISKFHLPHPF